MPKLEIIRNEDAVEIYLDGKRLIDYVGHRNKLDAVEEAARVLGEALGADVGQADEPTPQPYRYYIVFSVSVKRDGGWDYMPAVRWLDLPRPIEGPEDTDRLCAEFGGGWPVENVRIVNFILTDGPS